MAHSAPELAPPGYDEPRVRGHVDHPVVGGEQGACAARKPCQSIQSRVELFESREPRGRLGTGGVTSHVKLGHVGVDERRLGAAQQVDRRLHAFGDRRRDDEPRAAQNGVGERGIPVAGGGHHDGIDARRPGRLEERGVRLPLQGVEIGGPRAELLHDAVALRISDGVAHHAVLARGEARRERGERGRRRRGEARIDRSPAGGYRGQEAPGVTGARTQRRHPEAIGEQHCGGAHRGQGQPRGLRRERGESTRQHVGE